MYFIGILCERQHKVAHKAGLNTLPHCTFVFYDFKFIFTVCYFLLVSHIKLQENIFRVVM